MKYPTVLNRKPLIINRSEAYIGVLIDDLTTCGTNEPYRMFTSRAEFRLHLRPDNADIRLTVQGHESGCISKSRMERYSEGKQGYDTMIQSLKSCKKPIREWLRLVTVHTNVRKVNVTSGEIKSAWDLLAAWSYGIEVQDVLSVIGVSKQDCEVLEKQKFLAEKIKIEALYERFIEEQKSDFEEVRKDEKMELPVDIDYASPLLALSMEEQEKLSLTRPTTIGSMSRIPGITPNAVIAMLRHVKKQAVLAA